MNSVSENKYDWIRERLLDRYALYARRAKKHDKLFSNGSGVMQQAAEKTESAAKIVAPVAKPVPKPRAKSEPENFTFNDEFVLRCRIKHPELFIK